MSIATNVRGDYGKWIFRQTGLLFPALGKATGLHAGQRVLDLKAIDVPIRI